jgi:hypothetical protein
MYSQSQNIGKSNNLKFWQSNKTKEPKEDSQNHLMSPVHRAYTMKVIPEVHRAYTMKVIPEVHRAYTMKVIPEVHRAYTMERLESQIISSFRNNKTKGPKSARVHL